MVSAPTKTLKFDPDVLIVLRDQVAWSDDGLSATMPQLDRKMYERVAKAFDLMGGKWNRKAKATLFPSDPRGQVEGLIQTGTMVIELDGFFRTPANVTRYIMGRMALGTADYNWLEPEAGDGAMVKVLLDEGFPAERIYAIEKNAARCAELRKLGVRVAHGDFLRFLNSVCIPFHRILMNPPFEREQDMEHVFQAYRMLADGGVMGAILSEGAFFHDTARGCAFRDFLKNRGAYIEKLPERSFHQSGTDVATRFIIIHKSGKA